MTESPPPTTSLPVVDAPFDADPEVYPTSASVARRSSAAGSPGPDVKPEAPRRHPVAYAGLALSIIALLWLAVLSSRGGDHYQKVRVGTQDCVSVPQDNAPAALYCRTSRLDQP